MKLLLSGGGSSKQTEKLDKFFLSLVLPGKKILYIPIAKKTRSFKDCYTWIKETLYNVGFAGEIVMWTDLNHKKLKDLNDFGAIYIGGGNTFSLLKDLKEANFLEILRKYVHKKGVIYGGSAGALILGKDISLAMVAGDKNDVRLKDISALNLIRGHNIWPHYNQDQNKKIKDILTKNKIPIIAIPEGTGLYVKDYRIFVKGTGSVYLFNKKGKRRFNKDEEISLK